MTIIHHGLRSSHRYFEGNKNSLKWLNDIPHYAYVCSAKITVGKKCIFWLVRRFYTIEKILKGIKQLGSDINPSRKVKIKALVLIRYWNLYGGCSRLIDVCVVGYVVILFCEEMIIYERSLQDQHFLTVKPVTLTCRFFNTGKSSGQAALQFLHNITSCIFILLLIKGTTALAHWQTVVVYKRKKTFWNMLLSNNPFYFHVLAAWLATSD